MTANIDPAQLAALAAADAQRTARAGTAKPGNGAFAAALEKAQGTELSEATPPPELSAHIATAARAWAALDGAGQHVSFADSSEGSVQILLADSDGTTPRTLSGSDLFDLIEREGGS
ncbi:MAG: hypothetical protein ABSC56_01075 [Solirubrobacteraceae bacterium]